MARPTRINAEVSRYRARQSLDALHAATKARSKGAQRTDPAGRRLVMTAEHEGSIDPVAALWVTLWQQIDLMPNPGDWVPA
jgi:hypothetical protein